MVNLLPLEEKQKIILKDRESIAMIIGVIFLVGIVCLIMFLLSVKFYLLSELDSQKMVLAQDKKDVEVSSSQDLASTIIKYNKILSQVNNFYVKEMYFGQIFKIISDTPASGVYFKNISLVRGAEGQADVVLSGTSETRDDLINFKKNIEAEKSIQSPYFSPDSWVSPKNANFSLTFKVKIEGK